MSKKIRVTITADVNDGDYIHKIIDITQKELDRVGPVIKEIQKINQSNNSRHNYEQLLELRETQNKLSELIEEFMENYVPFMDNQDVHTIISISYCEAPKHEWEFLD